MCKYKIFVIDGSFESLMTMVYLHYYEKIFPDNIIDDQNCNIELDSDYIFINKCEYKAMKVMKGFLKKFDKNIFDFIYFCYLCENEKKYFDIYRLIVLLFEKGKDSIHNLTIDYVLNCNNYQKFVKRELHSIKEFCRFKETVNEIYYCDISPVNNILTFVCEHFVDRFNDMNFIIHDVSRNIAGIYNKSECVFRETPNNINVTYSDTEKNFQKLWYQFYQSITNKERINIKCQNLFLPKRYRKHITEFNFELEKYKEENNILSSNKDFQANDLKYLKS